MENSCACSFCGTPKTSNTERTFVAGEDCYICSSCLSLCRDIIQGQPIMTLVDREDMYPKKIKAFLDEHIIGQDRAKKALSVAVYNHYKRIQSEIFDVRNRKREDKKDENLSEESEGTKNQGPHVVPDESKPDEERGEDIELTKGNILLIGPTGSGKTLMAKTLAKKLNVPYTIADATSLTEAGYVGEDVENIIKNLWIAADRNVEQAAKGIVCIDEIDKLGSLSSGPSSSRDVGGEGVQQALLKMVESSKVTISPDGSKSRPQQEFISIDTTNILFICCGSFQGLEGLIARRLGKSRVGFGNEMSEKISEHNNILRHVRPTDLNQFGLIPEFIGRFPVIVTFDQLEERELVEILWKPKNSLIAQYQKLLKIEGVKLHFEHGALVEMVRKAAKRGTGARGLRSIIEEVMLDTMYDIPSLPGVTECIITESCVTKNERPTLVYEQEKPAA